MSKTKAKKKVRQPFKGYSLEEIKKAEATLYVIQMGTTVYVHQDGQMSFTKKEVEHLFEVIHAGLADMLKNGTFEEREDARDTFKSFRIMPLRFN